MRLKTRKKVDSEKPNQMYKNTTKTQLGLNFHKFVKFNLVTHYFVK